MSILDNLTTEELFTLIKLKHRKELPNYFSGNKLQQLHSYLKSITLKNKHYSKFQTLISTLLDGPMYPFYILSTLLNVLSLAILPLSLITLFGLLLTVAFSGIYLFLSYKENKKIVKDDQKRLILAFFKNRCADVLISKLSKHNQHLRMCDQKTPIKTIDVNHNQFNPFLPVKKGLSLGLLMTSVFFGSYYLNTISIMSAFGLTALTSVLLSPIAISTALVAATFVGIFFGVKNYLHFKQTELINNELKEQKKEFNFKSKLCYKLKEKFDKAHLKESILENRTANKRCFYSKLMNKRNHSTFFSNAKSGLLHLKPLDTSPNPQNPRDLRPSYG